MHEQPFVDLIAGARPNFVKIAALIRGFEALARAFSGPGVPLTYRLVHTGQHYDPRLSGAFFEQLEIPAPSVNLDVGSGTHATQTAAILTGYEALLLAGPRPLATVVVGDVTSTLACALAAQKLHIPVAHVEGGIRSGDWSMPEEINRLATDAITNWFFTTSHVANEHLRKSGVEDERIFFVGNTMIDTLLAQRGRFRAPPFWGALDLAPKGYLVVTLHRPSNVDDPVQLNALLEALSHGADGIPVIFPVHPRTRARLDALGPGGDPAGGAAPGWTLPANVHLVEPQPYLEFNYLVEHALGVVTDSGGITEETTVLGVPCMTLRDSTERPETVTLGTNELLGSDPAALHPALARLLAGAWKSGTIPPLWDGKTGERIARQLSALLLPAPGEAAVSAAGKAP
jgi:UDP-N-acetylglucosamine 2-epimerase (non-hydrolysing)